MNDPQTTLVMPLWALGLGAFAVAALVTWAVTPGVIRLAFRLGLVDVPDERKVHAQPVPRIGGVAVFAGFLAGLTFAAALSGVLWTVPKVGVYWRGFVMAATGLFLVGLWDDIRGLSFRWKFAAQILAALFMWHAGFRIEVLSAPGPDELIVLGWLALPVTVFWIVLVTNAVNLIDGLDGLAAGTAFIMTASLGVIAAYRGELSVTAVCIPMAGALLAFLRYNFNPARIFLGDSGSLFLGFALAVSSIRGSQKGPTAVVVLIPVLLLGLPLLDTALAVLRRAYRVHRASRANGTGMRGTLREFHQVFLPDRKHIHHRLLSWGMSHAGAVLLLYAAAGLCAAAAMAVVFLKSKAVAALLLATIAAGFWVVFLIYGRRQGASEAPPEAASLPTPAKARRSHAS